VLGLLVGFGGILLLVWPDVTAEGAAGHQFLIGLAALQTACVGWAAGSAVSRRHAREENALSAAAIQMAFGGIFLLIAGTLRGEWSRLAFTRRTLAAEVYLTLVGSIVGYSAYTYALKYLPTATVSLYAYVNPIIAIVLGAALLGEPLGPRVGYRFRYGAGGIGGSAVEGPGKTATHSPLRSDVTGRSVQLRPGHAEANPTVVAGEEGAAARKRHAP
jgi:uncharacterized membrane protein